MNRVTDFLRKYFFIDRFNCIVCDAELQKEDRLGLCPECRKALRFNNQHTCAKCGIFMPDEAEYCLTCQNQGRVFDRACSALVYEDQCAGLVYRLKFGHAKYLASYLAAFMVDTWLDEGLSADLLVPVPLSKKRQRERGYNQAEVLADEIGKRLNIEVDAGLVERVRDTPAQARMSAKEREENLKGAFCLKKEADLSGRRVVIIDDVMTTGATLNELTATLKKTRPQAVYALTFASAAKKIYSESAPET